MAEFKEVMRQARRMCNRIPLHKCGDCKVHSGKMCLFKRYPVNMTEENAAELERVVMAWAEEHPEPRCPTWVEWYKANFPDARHDICPNYFMSNKPLGTCAVSCKKCTNTPIPADIAEKLGIKPVGGDADA